MVLSSLSEKESRPLRRTLWRQRFLDRIKALLSPHQFHLEHILFYTPVLMSCGIGAYFSLSFEPDPHLIFNLWLGSLTCLWAAHELHVKTNRHNGLRVFFYLLCIIMSGFFLAQKRTVEVQAQVLERPLKFADLEGTIKDIEILPDQKGQRLTLSNLFIEDLPLEKTPVIIRLKVQSPQSYRAGQRIHTLAALHPPSPPSLPGGFDYQFHSFFKQMGATGFTYKAPEVLESPPRTTFSDFWENLRIRITHVIQKTLPTHNAGVAVTFMTGEKSTIPPDDLDAMRHSGLAHLLAISGLHVGLMAGFVFFFVRLGLAAFPSLALTLPIKKIAAILALSCAIIYTFLVGADVPTLRAMVMTGIALFAITIDRSPFSLRMVALAACLILVLYPESLASASFQMSFAAVTALIWFYDFFRLPLQNLYREAGIVKRILLYFVGIALTTLIAGSATSLYGLYHFQSWSVYSMAANIAAMPVVGLIVMPAAVLSYLLMPLGLSFLSLPVMGWGIEWVLIVAHTISELDGAVLTIPSFSIYILSGVTLGLIGLLIGPMILRVLGGFLLIILLYIQLSQPAVDKFLISSDGTLIGFYDSHEQSLYVSSLKTDRYDRERWEEALGLSGKITKAFKDYPSATCGSEGCRMTDKDHFIALPSTPFALQEDCLWADIILTPHIRKPSSCNQSAMIFDRKSLSRNGASVIIITKESMTLQSVNQMRGSRPWVH